MIKKFLTPVLIVLLLSGYALALEFSADTITTHKGTDKTKGKIYYKADRSRMDMESPQKVSVVTRMDKKIIWNIMHNERMYMEMPFDPKNKPMVEEKFEGEIERKHVGNETIDGHPTKKYLITYKLGNEKHQVYQWWATDINFPVKNAAVDSSWVQEFKNVKIGSQPNSLFEVPVGYQKFQFKMPGRMNFKIK